MNSKILKTQNPNKKKLLIIKDYKENLQELPEISNSHQCSHIQRNKSQEFDKHTILPPINIDNTSHISIGLPTQIRSIKRKYSLASSTSSTKVSTGSKLKPSSFFGNSRLANLKIQDIVRGFIEDFENRNIFHLHFGKYLI